jgi:hypothetical protein
MALKLKNIAWFVVKIRARIGRGQGWLYYIKDVAYVSITLYIFEDVLKRFGIDDPLVFKYLYILLPIAYFAACYVIGFLDEKYGIWKMEAVYGSKDLNPFMERMDAKLDKLCSAVKKKKKNKKNKKKQYGAQ